jgi:thiamine kinase-like enzyme
MSSDMYEHTATVLSALSNVSGFETIKAKECKITRLGGMTNLVHLVETKDANIIVRIPGEGTESYINRATELTNATAAWRAGISAEVIWADVKTGVMISRAIDGVETMTPTFFRTRSGSPMRAGKALAKLHNSGETFDFRFELFTMIEDYLKVLSTKDVNLPDGYHDIVKAANPVKEVLDANPIPLTPCHCDPLCENFLDDGKNMWIVDWEYSGMNDPLWDLGDLSVEAGMDDTQEAKLLSAYFGAEPTAAQKGRVIIYKAMCDLLWTLWGLIQLADDNPADDFWVYATGRFERCKTLMQKKDFDEHVAAVKESVLD